MKKTCDRVIHELCGKPALAFMLTLVPSFAAVHRLYIKRMRGTGVPISRTGTTCAFFQATSPDEPVCVGEIVLPLRGLGAGLIAHEACHMAHSVVAFGGTSDDVEEDICTMTGEFTEQIVDIIKSRGVKL